MSRALPSGSRTVIIEPRHPGALARLGELWRYRRLTSYFGRMQLEKLYMRTWLGWLWVPLRPVLMVATQVFVFGGLIGVASHGIPYALFFLVGFSVWQLFALVAYWGTRSLELSRRVLTRMYVPRLTCLLGSLVPGGVIFLLFAGITFVAMLYVLATDGRTYLALGPETALVAAGLAMTLALALGIGAWLAPYAARARDVRWGLAYVLSFWFFLSPIIYPLSQVPASFRTVTNLNPMTAPLEMVRRGLFGFGEITPVALTISLTAIIVIGVSGLWSFFRAEAASVDAL